MIVNWILDNFIAPLFISVKKEIHMARKEIVDRIEAQSGKLDKILGETTGLTQTVAELRDALAAEGIGSNAINAALTALEAKTAAIDALVEDKAPVDVPPVDVPPVDVPPVDVPPVDVPPVDVPPVDEPPVADKSTAKKASK